MKKWLSFFLVAALGVSLLLWFVQDWWLISWQDQKTNQYLTQETDQVDLNTFLAEYASGTFEKLVLKDVVTLEWYQLLEWQTPTPWVFGLTPKDAKLYKKFETNKPADTSLGELGIDLNGTTIVDVQYTETSLLTSILLEQILPLVFFIFVLVLAFRMFGPKGWWLPFGTKTWKLRTNTDVKTKFADVAWMDEVKDELIEIVDYLKSPKKYQAVWAKIPKWVLLYGPPGSGKTLLAKAVAWEAWVPFFSASGSEFMEMLVWMGAAKVRELFNKAKAASPSIIFIDEIDTIGRKRWWGHTGWHQEQEQTLNQILTEMDGFDTGSSVIVIAATNRPDILDKALLRSWRFDRKIMVGNPTLEERVMILKIHLRGKKIAESVDIELLARRTSGFVWADLANIINEAALKIARDGRKEITNADLDYALEKIVMGPEKRIKNLKAKEREIVTYHELGHAITAYHLEHADPVEKISIVSRGMALGVTWMMPTEDTYLYSKAKFLDEMVTLLGWRAAEEVFFGKDNVTTWASNDFEKITKIARNMILKYGMDPDIGTLIWHDPDKSGYTSFQPYSEKLAEQIDSKIKGLVDQAYARAIQLVEENKWLMEKMAMLLMEKEYITKDEFMKIMDSPSQADQTIQTYMEDFKKHQKLLEKEKKKLAKAQKKKNGKDDTETDIPPSKKDLLNGKELKKTLEKFLKR